jgi:hypothetical protein
MFTTASSSSVRIYSVMLFSTDMSQDIDTELQQCCFQQLAIGLLQTEESAL